MDFIDFDSYQETSAEGGTNLPSPQPALSLPITTNIENLGKRFSNFNNLTRNLLKRDETSTKDTNYSKEIKIAEKYAKLSLNIIDKEETVLNESTGPIKHNSLSNRLSRVLNNQMNDSFIKEVFINLEDKYSDNLTSNNIKELIEPGVNGSISRKKLRGLIENELIKNQSSVLKEYSPTIKQLKVLQEKLVKLNELNNSTNEKIDKNYQLSSHFNSRIVDLNKEKKSIMLKKNLLINFKAKFTLDEYEEFVLSSGEINDEYFKVLQKAELINENCSILLSIDNPQLGLKIMSKINQIINKSIDKIVNFTNKSLGNLYSLNSKTKLTILQKCLKYLKNKMNYYNSIVANFTESRSKVLLDDFLNEIQVSSSGSKNSRPIFISAHDPIRFIGDLLAYIHSIVVNEIETISNIFLTDDNISKNNEILNKILKPLSKPF
jgi:conserved oligomeric Golgi complex subunit 6